MNVANLYSLPMFSQATSAVNAYPTGIGPMSRTVPVGGWWEDLTGAVSPALTDIGKQFLQSQFVRGLIAAKEAAGYKNLGAVVIDGKPYVKMLNNQKVAVLIDDKGVETFATPETQAKELKIDSSGNIVTGAAIGVGLAVAGIALFLLLRRK
jgi:hypothetical protein